MIAIVEFLWLTFLVVAIIATSSMLFILSTLLVATWMGKTRRPRPSPGISLVFCECCEAKAAEKLSEASSLSSVVVTITCRNQLCGFTKVVRDDFHPGNVGVKFDPGMPDVYDPVEDPWNQSSR